MKATQNFNTKHQTIKQESSDIWSWLVLALYIIGVIVGVYVGLTEPAVSTSSLPDLPVEPQSLLQQVEEVGKTTFETVSNWLTPVVSKFNW